MIITTRKCDVCHGIHTSDQKTYRDFGEYTSPDGNRLDVCPACEMRLLEPLARGYVKTCEGGC